MLQKVIPLLVWLFVLVAPGCGQKPPSIPAGISDAQLVQKVAGEYTGRYLGGVEQVVIGTNGIYSQTFVVNGKTNYVNSGKWTLWNDSNRLSVLTFYGFLSQQDRIDKSGQKVMRVDKLVEYYWDDRCLTLGVEGGYIISRE